MPKDFVKTDKPFPVFSIEADVDYLLARHIHFLGSVVHSRAGYFAHMACEKYMKAFLVQESQSYLPTHKLSDLADACSKYFPYFSEGRTLQILKNFDSYDQVARYGGAAKFDPLSQKTDAFETAGVLIWTDSRLEALDEFVFYVRQRLDFGRIRFEDSLLGLLEGKPTNKFRKLWKGRPPASVVLTKENRFFKKAKKSR